MTPQTDVALKEWSLLCKALADGRQTLLVRKGGIHDKRGEFEVEHREFFLFPTYYHAKAKDVLPAAQAELEALQKSAPPPSEVHVGLYAEVADTYFLKDEKTIQNLADMHLYSNEALSMRYHYRKPGVWVVVLRAYALPQEFVLTNTKEYEGCVSWVPLEKPLPTAGARPVLSDEEFEKKRAAIRKAVG